MSPTSVAVFLSVVVPVCVQFVVFLRWLHRRMRDDEIVRACVRDIALQHLPYIHGALQRLAGEQGIALSAPPVVRFLDLDTPLPGASR